MKSCKNSNQNYFVDGDTRIVFIDGNICDTISKFYVTLQSQLSIPDYFGCNLDALDEVLADLEWIPEERIKIIIINKRNLLASDKSKKNALLEVLKESHRGKLAVCILGEESI